MPHPAQVPSSPAVAKAGLLYDALGSPDGLITAYVDEATGIKPGLLVERSSTDWQGKLPDAPVADPNGIIDTIASAAAPQTLAAADCDGVLGAGPIWPPSRLDLVLNSHTDWDATEATLVYEDEHGVIRRELLAIPDAGNATVSSLGYARRFISLTIPAQTGTNGTADLGVQGPEGRLFAGQGLLGVSVFAHKALVNPSSDDNETFEDNVDMPVARKRRMWVLFENAFTPQSSVYARVASGTGTVIGGFRADDDDTATCIAVPGIKVLTSGSAGEFGVIEVDL